MPRQREQKKVKEREAIENFIGRGLLLGCGAPLRNSEPDAPGYMNTETYALVSISLYYLYGIFFCFLVLIFLWALKLSLVYVVFLLSEISAFEINFKYFKMLKR